MTSGIEVKQDTNPPRFKMEQTASRTNAMSNKPKENPKACSQDKPMPSTGLSKIASRIPINITSSATVVSQRTENAHATMPNLARPTVANRDDDKHSLSTKSPKMWYFGTKTWVAHAHEIPVPSELIAKWPEIKERLTNDLKDVRTEMLAEQAREKRRCKKEPKRRHIVSELRMSGRQNNPFSDFVTISPCVWILCGSKSCRDKVRRITKTLSLPINFVQQPIEVHDGAPEFNSTRASIPLSQLQHDFDMDSGLRHLGGVILHHVESTKGPDKIQSACGLLCCTTLLRNGKVIKQRVSRFGGLLARFPGDDNNIGCPIAMTTSHGIFDCLWLDNQEPELPGRQKSPFPKSLLLNDKDDLTHSSGSDTESVSDSNSDADPEFEFGKGKNNETIGPRQDRNPLGRRDALKVDSWASLNEIIGIKFFRQQFPDQVKDHTLTKPGDYALLRSDTLQGLRNILSVPKNLEISSYMKNEELVEGPLTMVFGADNLSEVFLLPEPATMPSVRGDLPVRKVQLSAPLGNRVPTSGMPQSRN